MSSEVPPLAVAAHFLFAKGESYRDVPLRTHKEKAPPERGLELPGVSRSLLQESRDNAVARGWVSPVVNA